MVVITRELIKRTVESFEQQADAARINQNFDIMASLRFRAVTMRERLSDAPSMGDKLTAD